jgi:hypothetical protein
MENDVLQPDSILRMSGTMAEERDSYGRPRIGSLDLKSQWNDLAAAGCMAVHAALKNEPLVSFLIFLF